MRIAFSPSVNFYIAPEATDLNRCDVTAHVNTLYPPPLEAEERAPVRLKQTHLDYLADIVCAIDSAFTGRAKPQRPSKPILPCSASELPTGY